MPTDPPENDPGEPTPAPPPAGPTADQVRAMVREELAAILTGGTEKETPEPRTDKEMEAYVESLVQKGMAALAEDGKPPPDPTPDPTPEPEIEPETKRKWQDRLRTALWD
jgi:hypothetical protein